MAKKKSNKKDNPPAKHTKKTRVSAAESRTEPRQVSPAFMADEPDQPGEGTFPIV